MWRRLMSETQICLASWRLQYRVAVQHEQYSTKVQRIRKNAEEEVSYAHPLACSVNTAWPCVADQRLEPAD